MLSASLSVIQALVSTFYFSTFTRSRDIKFGGFLTVHLRVLSTVMFSIGWLRVSYENARLPFPLNNRFPFCPLLSKEMHRSLNEISFLLLGHGSFNSEMTITEPQAFTLLYCCTCLNNQCTTLRLRRAASDFHAYL